MNKKTVLFVFMVLLLALVPATVMAQGEGTSYTIQADDWLSKLAEKEYGDPLAYPAIVYYTNEKAATDSTFAAINDPDLIEVGWVIYLPTAEEATAYLSGSVGEPVTLTMAAWDLSTTPYWQAVIDAYEAQNPNVTVELIDISSAEYTNKIQIMLSGGDETDIITVKDIPQYSAMLTRNQVVPLNSYVEKDGLDLSVYSGAAEELTYEGSIYALPFRSDIWILYYNKDLFDKAGVTYPTNDMTWAQFDSIAREMTSGSGADKVYGAHFHTWRSTVELPTFQDGKNTAIATDYSFMKPMYDMVIGMQDDGIIMDYGELRAGSVHYSGVFWNQQVAMLPMGSWFIGSMIAAKESGDIDFNWDVVKYPHPEGVAPGTTAGTLTSLAINSNSANKDAAWDFIKFYSGPQGAKALAATGNLPAMRTPEVLRVFASRDGMPDGVTEALQTVTVRLELPMDPHVGAVEQILNEEHELIMTKSVSVDEGIAEMTSRISEALAE
jgi:multiple sugar transport system substrate-binding protein